MPQRSNSVTHVNYSRAHNGLEPRHATCIDFLSWRGREQASNSGGAATTREPVTRRIAGIGAAADFNTIRTRQK
jgi:hypothetical protein